MRSHIDIIESTIQRTEKKKRNRKRRVYHHFRTTILNCYLGIKL